MTALFKRKILGDVIISRYQQCKASGPQLIVSSWLGGELVRKIIAMKASKTESISHQHKYNKVDRCQGIEYTILPKDESRPFRAPTSNPRISFSRATRIEPAMRSYRE